MAFQDFDMITERRKNEQRMKTRKKILLGVVSSVLLACIVAAIAFAVVQKVGDSKEKEEEPSVDQNARLVRMICASAEYRDKCETSIEEALKKKEAGATEPKDLLMVAMILAEKEATRVWDATKSKMVSANEAEKRAYKDCSELFTDAKEELETCVTEVGQNDADTLSQKGAELNNWLSAVMSYQQTCIDGFPDGKIKDDFTDLFNDFRELISNALAVVHEFASFFSIFQGASGFRLPWLSSDSPSSNASAPAPGAHPPGQASSTSAPGAAPRVAPGAAPHSAPGPAPHSAPVPAPHSAPVPAPDSAPVPAPDSAPVPAPDSAPGPAPDSAPGPAPDSAPGPAPDSAPDSAPGPAPDSAPGPAPDSAPGPAPDSAPDAAPGSCPDSAPDAAPGAAPESAPGAAPDSPPAPPPVPVAPLPGAPAPALASPVPGWANPAEIPGSDEKPKPNVVVAKDGSGDFNNIIQALAAIPATYEGRYVVYVKEGVYDEHVIVDKKMFNVFMYGDGQLKTIITGSKNNIDGVSTFQTASFSVLGQGFMAKDMGFRNTAGAVKEQAVAARVQADRSIFLNCAFEGFQDTLYAQTHRQFFRDCYISGTIDFIFGDASAVFQNCTIIIKKPLENQQNIITAQGRTDPQENTGFVIQNCIIKGEEELIASPGRTKNYLARPWKEFSRTIFMENQIDGLIDPEGYLPWKGDFGLKTLYYGEYNNKGPGAVTNARVNWPTLNLNIQREEATKYTVEAFLQGTTWINGTSVPVQMGLYS